MVLQMAEAKVEPKDHLKAGMLVALLAVQMAALRGVRMAVQLGEMKVDGLVAWKVAVKGVLTVATKVAVRAILRRVINR